MEREHALAREATRRQAASLGTHRADANGRFRTEFPVSVQIDETVAPDAIRIGGNVMKISTAKAVGLVGEDGKTLTAKGQAAAKRAGDGPAARPAATASTRHDVAQRELERLDPEYEDDLDTDADEDIDEDDLDDVTTVSSDAPDAADRLISEGRYAVVVEQAEDAIADLEHSRAYQDGLERYLGGENIAASTLENIAKDLGISVGEAGQRVNAVMAGFQAEAAFAVADVLSPSEAASFVDYLTAHRQDAFDRAAQMHVRHGTTVGWLTEARTFKEAISSIGDPSDYLGTHRGGTVVEEGGRFWLRREGHPPLDLFVAAASGLVRPR